MIIAGVGHAVDAAIQLRINNSPNQTNSALPVSIDLDSYAELAVRVALNLQPGQRLLIIGPLTNGGVSLEAAPLVRQIAAAAYRAGARLVEPLWGDEALQSTRLQHARAAIRSSEFSAWLPQALAEHAEARPRGAVDLRERSRSAPARADRSASARLQQATSRSMSAVPRARSPATRPTGRVVAARGAGVGGASVSRRRRRSSRSRGCGTRSRSLCRLDRPDPVAAWETHLAALAARSEFLNAERYTALRYTGPGTDLTLGLPAGHVWVGGSSASAAASASRRTCRPKKCSRCRTRIASTASCARPSRSATAAR